MLSNHDQLVGYPNITVGNSLLRKYLSKDIWNELKEKNDAYNFSFREAIFSGIRNTDSGIGVYAGSHDSYTAFAPMFD